MKKILRGKIKLIEQDGGYDAPKIEIGDLSLSDILSTLPSKTMTDGPDIFDTILDGDYKITIERIT